MDDTSTTRGKMGEKVLPFQNELWNQHTFFGYLKRKSRGVLKSWKREFFVLTVDGKLFHFGVEKGEPKKIQMIWMMNSKFWICPLKKKSMNCIRIEEYPDPLIFHAETEGVINQWSEKLTEVGGIRCELDLSFPLSTSLFTHKQPEISKKDVSRWTKKDVTQWLSYQSFLHDPRDTTINLFRELLSGVNGKILSRIDSSFLIKQYQSCLTTPKIPFSDHHRSRIMPKIWEIQKYRKFRYSDHIVRRKLQKMVSDITSDVLVEILDIPPSMNMNFFVRALSDPSVMVQAYLDPSSTNSSFKKYFGSLENYKNDENEENEGEEEDDDTMRGYLYEPEVLSEDDGGGWNIKKTPKEKMRILVKIFITEMNSKKGLKDLEETLNPMSNILSFSEDKNMSKYLRTGLFIGNWFFEWSEHSLCIPQKWKSDLGFIIKDTTSQFSLKNITYPEIVSKIAQTVCRWNTTMRNPSSGYFPDFIKCMSNRKQGIFFYDRITYPNLNFNSDLSERYKRFLITIHCVFSRLDYIISKDVVEHRIIPFISEYDVINDWKEYDFDSSSPSFRMKETRKKRSGTCHDFVDDLLNSIGFEHKKEGAYGRFLDTIKREGFSEMVFHPSKQFKQKFRLKRDEIRFESHVELDELVRSCSMIDEIGLVLDFREEHKLLKSFDRLFWYRHFKFSNAEEFKPARFKCPFGRPTGRRYGGYVVYQ